MFARTATRGALRLFTRYAYFNQKFDRSKDYYQILGLTRHANEKEIKDAFYKMAKKYHPDSHKGFEEEFKKVNEAYTILSDPPVKKEYD